MKSRKFNIPLPKEVELALSVLKQNGFQAYIVGGAVRDALMGKEPHDFDIASSSTPNQTMRSFPGYDIIRSGLKHGTVRVIIHHYPIEITTFRSESGYSDYRHPDTVVFESSPEKDSNRRDFTINGFYYADNRIYDFHTGFEDLDNKLIRAIGNPYERFKEDALRIMRALRFSCQFNFQIEEETKKAMEACADELFQISEERIEAELLKTASYPQVFQALASSSAVIERIISGFEKGKENLSALTGSNNPWSNLATIFFSSGYSALEADESLRKLKFSNSNREAIRMLLNIDAKYSIESLKGENTLRFFLLETQPLNFEVALEYVKLRDLLLNRNIEDLSFVQELYNKNEINNAPVTVKDLKVTGNDLKRLGYKPGPTFKSTLEELLYLVNQNRVANDRKAQLLWLKNNLIEK